MTPEGKVKKHVKELLAQEKYAQHLWANWPVPAGYGVPMLDCIGSFKGRAFAIETKAPGEHLTERQKFTADEMERGGMKVFVIGEKRVPDGYSGMSDLRLWLEWVLEQ